MATTKPVLLHIDTTGDDAAVRLIQDGNTIAALQWASRGAAELLLKKIDSMLRKNDLTLNQLTGIMVNEKAVSFTGTRVGVTVANTLGYLLKIPVNGKKPPIAINYGGAYRVKIKK